MIPKLPNKAAPAEKRRANINTTAYDPETRNLDVTFHNGRIYRYYDVDPKHDAPLRNSSSQGSYLHQHIIPHHDFTELRK